MSIEWELASSCSTTYGGDNGFVFEWNIEFNPGILPDVTTFSQSLVAGSGFSFWDVICPMPEDHQVWMTEI